MWPGTCPQYIRKPSPSLQFPAPRPSQGLILSHPGLRSGSFSCPGAFTFTSLYYFYRTPRTSLKQSNKPKPNHTISCLKPQLACPCLMGSLYFVLHPSLLLWEQKTPENFSAQSWALPALLDLGSSKVIAAVFACSSPLVLTNCKSSFH